jgi:hypothetical protein
VKPPAFRAQSGGFGSSPRQLHFHILPYLCPSLPFASSQGQSTIVRCGEVCAVKGASEGQPRPLANCLAGHSHQPKFNVCAKLRKSFISQLRPLLSTICSCIANSSLRRYYSSDTQALAEPSLASDGPAEDECSSPACPLARPHAGGPSGSQPARRCTEHPDGRPWSWLISEQDCLSWAEAVSFCGQPAATPHLPAPSPATIRRMAVLRFCKGKALCLRRHSVHVALHGVLQPAPS